MRNKWILIFSLFLTHVCTWGYEVTDTVSSSKGDKVIVTYNIKQKDRHVDVEFINVRKILGYEFSDKYYDLNKIVVLFFDKIGNYTDGTKFTGMTPDAFMPSADVEYEYSKDGYLFVTQNSPTLSLELKNDEPVELSVPLYLAYNEKKQQYNIFSSCNKLTIKTKKKKTPIVQDETTSQIETQTVISQVETGGIVVDATEINKRIERIKKLLDEQDTYPFSDELKEAISKLRNISYITKDNNLSSKIENILSECDQKEKVLESAAKANQELKEAAEKARQDSIHAAEQARQDSIQASIREQEAKEKKLNIWLIIGGVFLAILLFIGNQVFQHFRNLRNQKNIMDMQQNMVKRAEDEAKRRARNMTRTQMNNVEGGIRRKTRSVINEGTKNVGKNKKKFTI